ncbi:disease resistance RPP13-like protein 1 [Pyrus ussuriensis x Pyrus communis]|uniref:Disease resistance RPP13-like protein 1 n=1 Tax=Pyrus ussuriensis x Pyrus communis TaxID=2448454 RepID=A0A5N5I1X6_9ROSA|nr:disease resistance RPP13-like protein 1 [Pyrus ussuriensis x Pyrus communis]KAB2634206.1 disease resistance RPP13-like protein 1 [Pyrus ussuriensis x Pyrus communis]
MAEFKEFNKVQESLSKELSGKKFLIVLDDVWNTCVYDLCTKLQSPFRVGALGSKIVVTTRDANVAKMMGSTIYQLDCISDDQCWKVFEHHSLLDITNNRPQNFELVKKKIVAKCSGLPLAARTLGGFLCCKQVGEWEEILNNKIYHYLPLSLKRCFAYCSLLPNDYEFGEKQLILLWVAEGLVQQRPEDKKQFEDTGNDYFQELLSRSLFQKASKGNDKYVMHDLVGELARWAAAEICFSLEDKGNDDLQLKPFPMARNMSYVSGEYDGVKKFEAISRVKHLRTFLLLSQSDGNNLTLLSLNGYEITELANAIGKLWNLRYLDLSYTQIKNLPTSITTLCNLQTLLLENCYNLKVLPVDMSNLITLRHLHISKIYLLEGMPPHLGRLTNLQSLPYFVVGKGSDQSGIREIGSANLIGKERLDSLELKWSYLSRSREMELGVLDMLQPPKNLKELTIHCYAGLKFSSWIRDPLFSNMVRVSLYNCTNCHLLPPVGQLPCLKELYISGMSAVEVVGPEFYGEGSLPFRVLEILKLSDMKHWEKWLPFDQDMESGVFPGLKFLSIQMCPKLGGELPKKLNSLTTLEIVRCEELVVAIANYEQVRIKDRRLQSAGTFNNRVDLKLLETLCLSNILELRLQAGGFTKGLGKIKELTILGCEELTSSLKNEDRCFSDNSALVEDLGKELEGLLQVPILACKLEYLEINKCCINCHLFRSFTYGNVHITECDSLVYVSKYQIPRNLKGIHISWCGSLKSLVEEEELVGSSSFSFSLSLEHLEISVCPSLTSLSLRGQLYTALKHLEIFTCEQLELIAPDGFFLDKANNSLEYISIGSCQNLKSLPEGLCHLSNLQAFVVSNCGSLVSILRLSWRRRASNLKEIRITGCEKLVVLPEDIHNLASLQELEIDYLEGLTSFPPNLTSLQVYEVKSCKTLWEWGLHKLTSLKKLLIQSEDPDVVSFPPHGKEEMLLPKSLTELTVSGFPNLKKFSKSIHFLTSLQTLKLHDCPKLASIPEEGLPLSLEQFTIDECPLLEERCQPGKGRYWPKISTFLAWTYRS